MEDNTIANLSQALYCLLHGSDLTLATAESCTAGAISAAIVARSGASEYFKGGVVSYCDEVKERLLGVAHEVLTEHTAVCEEVAIEMARGACAALSTDYAVAITGVAGPTGGSVTIPVGTIWICCASNTSHITSKLTGDRGREENLNHAVHHALKMLIQFIERESERAKT